MNSTTNQRQPIRLGLGGHEPENQIYLQNGSQSFLLTVQELVRACGMVNRMADIQTQTRDLLAKLEEWIADRRDRVSEGYLSTKGGTLFFMIVTTGKSFDQVLEDELTDLDILVANSEEFNLLSMDVLALPNVSRECIDSFLR